MDFYRRLADGRPRHDNGRQPSTTIPNWRFVAGDRVKTGAHDALHLARIATTPLPLGSHGLSILVWATSRSTSPSGRVIARLTLSSAITVSLSV